MLSKSFNPFEAKVLFLYHLKTSENLWFCDIFRGYRKETFSWNGLKIQTKLPRVYNPKSCLQYTCSLVFDVIDFICDLSLFKAINGNYLDIVESLIIVPWSINYDCNKYRSWKDILEFANNSNSFIYLWFNFPNMFFKT